MVPWCGQCWLLLLLLPTLLLAQDDCSHNCKNEANRYYVRPEGSAETLCPAQPCLTPSQLREHFSECERNNSCQTANTSLVLLPGTFTINSNHGSILPPLKFLSLTGYNKGCNTDSLATPSIDCNGTLISLMFQQIKCLHVRNCVVFTGNGTTVAVDHVTLHDSLIRLASITAADHSELDYNYTLGSQSYCLLQKKLADNNAWMPSHSVLALRNVSFSSEYHSKCAREYGIQLATIYATDSALDIADCLFTQNGITHISLLHSTLHTSGMVQFQNAKTAMLLNSSIIYLEGTVNLFSNKESAIRGTNCKIFLSGTVEFTNNTAKYGGAVLMQGGNMTVGKNAQVAFQGNHAQQLGGAIASTQHVTIAGSVQFISNSADQGGAVYSDGNVIIPNSAQVRFQGNHAMDNGGAIASAQYVTTIAGTVRFISNSANNQGGAVYSDANVTISNSAQVHFQGNHAIGNGGAIASVQYVTITAGSVKFINNSAYHGGAIGCGGGVTIANNAQVGLQGRGIGGAITSTKAGTVQFINNSAIQGGAVDSDGNVTMAQNTQVFFHENHVLAIGGAIYSAQHVTIAGSVQFINNSAYQGGAFACSGGVTTANNAHVFFQRNHAMDMGGAIFSAQQVTIAGSVHCIENSARQGGAVNSDDIMTIAHNAQVCFHGNHVTNSGGAIYSARHLTISGAVQFINNTGEQGGAVMSEHSMTIIHNDQVLFQGNHARGNGGAIGSVKHVTIAGTVQFINNSAIQGGGVASNGNVTIADNADVLFQANHATVFGGAFASTQHVTIASSVLFINNSAYNGGAIGSKGGVRIADNAQVLFQGNHATDIGGAIASFEHVTIAGKVQFNNNSAIQGGAVYSNGSVSTDDNAQVLFKGNHADTVAGGAIASGQHVTIAGSVQFINNSAYQGGAVVSNGNVTIANNAQVIFQGNYAESEGGVMVILSNLLLAGSVQFVSNTAQIGGAISLLSGHMTVANNTKAVFKGNHAYLIGGAIYSTASALLSYVLQTQPCLMSFGTNSTMDLLHNTANGGGSAMYGITTSKLVCETISDGDYDYEYLFDVITIIPDSFSAVSSDPLRVCICPDQSTPDCLAILPDQNTPHLHYAVYPGKTFTIHVAVVGFNFALTSGSVYAQFLNSEASLGSEFQKVQGVSHTGCSQLQYSVLSNTTQETLALTTNGRQVKYAATTIEGAINYQNNNTLLPNPSRYYNNNRFITNLTDGVFHLAGNVAESLENSPVFVSVHLLDCPPGFKLTDSNRCDCDGKILQNLLTCNISDQTVRRHGTTWVNASFSGNTSIGVIVHKHCPFEYCKSERVDVNLLYPESQCAFDHYGTLCGGCKPGHSLALGSSQCLSQCSNNYLLLLTVFILAGFALVFFIKILNLTVSQGTTNGLIFYANIVAANRSIFFPAHYSKVLSFLSVFISWLNLDLGIETCFIKGLDGYWKTWLQFVFPFYVWAIAGVIIVVSHYSTRATKIFGDKSISVLATLFLLSYAKLSRSIISIFSYTTLEYPDNTTAKVWSYDGNLQYLSSKHIPMFLFALAVVLPLWLPYTAVLLSAQWLRTQTHRKGLRWLKPFLDAYYGPFKDKHHYWVGVLLVVRGVLFVCFASFLAVEDNVNLLLISITSLTILTYTSFTGRLHKKVYTTILENLCFLNLGMLGIGTYHIRQVGGSQEAMVSTSVGIAFLEFCGITIFHSYQFVIIPIRQWYVRVRANDGIGLDTTVELQPLLNSDSPSDEDSVEYIPRNAVTHSEVRLSQLREEQDSRNPTTSADHQLPPADVNNPHSEEMLIHFNSDTPLSIIQQPRHTDQVRANQVVFNETTEQVLIPFIHNTLRPNIHPTELRDAKCNKDACTSKKSEAAAVSLDEPPPPPQESSEPPRYFAAEREERFIDFIAPRETLLEYTQYRLPQERNEPARDSTAERELLSAPHKHPQESSEPRYFAAKRDGPIDFTAPRESLLDYTQ